MKKQNYQNIRTFVEKVRQETQASPIGFLSDRSERLAICLFQSLSDHYKPTAKVTLEEDV